MFQLLNFRKKTRGKIRKLKGLKELACLEAVREERMEGREGVGPG